MTKTSLTCSFVLVATTLVAACFNTKDIQSGGLKCAPSAEPGNLGVCPDGFFCGEGHLCYSDGTENVAICQASEAQAPFGPFALCAPPSQSISLCDPVCQNGCSCSHRCQLVGDFESGFSFACVAPPGPPQRKTFDACVPTNDLCVPGTVCLDPVPNSTGCVSQCFRHCRQDADCADLRGSRCIFTIDGGDGKNNMLICSPPAVPCNPVQVGPASACANSATGSTCYVFSTTSPDETMCDCTGTRKAGEICQGPHSCEPGHECVDGTCRKMCLLDASGVGCANGQGCVPYANSTKFGTCQ
jgi:predicted small secreted protein